MLNIYSDIKALAYKLNEEQRNRFILFFETLKKDGLDFVLKRNSQRRQDISVDNIIEDINNITEYEKFLEIAEAAAKKGETAIPKEEWGVHEGHCCSKHGCKYGDIDCPVSLGLTEQDGDCFCCWEQREDNYY